MRKSAVMLAGALCAVSSVAFTSDAKPVLIPDAIVGNWHSKIVYGEKSPLTCESPKAKVNSIRIAADGAITALNASYSCAIGKLEYFTPSGGVLGEWSYAAECKLNRAPSGNEKAAWQEFGSFRLTDKNGGELEQNSSDRDAGFWDKDKGNMSTMTYFQCPTP